MANLSQLQQTSTDILYNCLMGAIPVNACKWINESVAESQLST